jgi:peptide/nickel transport system substrate-binding protein
MLNSMKSAIFCAAMVALTANPLFAEPKRGIAMVGEPALPADFSNFPYANPDAPKGGSITYGVIGTFDNLNPFILKSMRTTARGVIDTAFGNLVFESLMVRSADEPFTVYPLIAESVDIDAERTYVEFQLNPNAKWSDGKPVTPEDVIFTYETFAAKGRPPYSKRMEKIAKIEKTGDRGVKFTLNEKSDREFPLILAGATPILPKHAIDPAKFDETILTPLIGSGPYVIKTVTPGERIVFRRNPDYWAKDLPSKRGFDNYDTVTVDYFRNETSQFEAFKKGLFDVYPENDPVKWESNFNFPAVLEGKVIKEAFTSGTPANMYGYVFNTRRQVFADPKVRMGLSMLYDFEWTNKNLFGGKYARTGSFWQNSELSALGKPASEAEQILLGADASKVLPEVMDGTYRPSKTDGSGRDRAVMKKAFGILKEAGYAVNGGKMVGADGKPLAFEILTANEGEEKLALVYQRTLSKVGIDAQIRTVDDAQYQQRRQTWDYDIILATFSASLSPGIEQSGRWGTASKDVDGSFNYAGVADPAIDRIIGEIGKARNRETFTTAVRALDRLLISGQYLVPLHHLPEQWLARWEKIERPEKTPLFGYQLATWWAKPQ